MGLRFNGIHKALAKRNKRFSLGLSDGEILERARVLCILFETRMAIRDSGHSRKTGLMISALNAVAKKVERGDQSNW